MLIPQIDPQIVNKIQTDIYKRVSGFFLINKPVGVTSHDIVDDVRKILRTRKVGHAGALDPFAEGLLIILVGKYTRYTEALIQFDKSYRAEVLLGLATETQDPEGDITAEMAVPTSFPQDLAILNKTLTDNFSPEYHQHVPLFSSVKLQGQKLRVLARKAEAIKRLSTGKYMLTIAENGKTDELEITLPQKTVKIPSINVTTIEEVDKTIVKDQTKSGKFLKLTVDVSCSKGTYIRQLAEDIGAIWGLPAHLTSLQRLTVGSYSLSEALSVDGLNALATSAGIQK